MTIREVKMQARLSEWRSNIQEQKKSGQTIRQWCKEHNCGEGQYYYWLKLVRQQVLEQVEADHSATLVRISPERLPAVVPAAHQATEAQSCYASGSIIIHYENLSVEFPWDTASSKIAEMLKLLSHD
jgi:hypothetical protein